MLTYNGRSWMAATAAAREGETACAGSWYPTGMALVGLIRVTAVARLLGISPRTVLHWLGPARADVVRAPVEGMPGRTGAGRNSPNYVSIESATRLIDKLLPGAVDRQVAKRLRTRMREQARETERSCRGVRHQVGGTGSGAPPSNQAL